LLPLELLALIAVPSNAGEAGYRLEPDEISRWRA
jgi:hypothetical protein